MAWDKLIIDESAFSYDIKLDLVEDYYLTTLKIVENCLIDILAHLGIFRRGIPRAELEASFDEISCFPKIIKKVLDTMIKRGIVFEINTSGLRRPEAVTYPNRSILVLYKELGVLF